MRLVSAALILTSIGLCSPGGASREATISANATPDQPSTTIPVIVELFTSEGCSSCPPADALLARLEELQPVENVQILALEEHVDYWNNLGWSDPFSGSEWTARQRDYASSLGNGNVYTPQMVVNGHAEFVGSRADQAQQAILKEAASGSPVAISISSRQTSKKSQEQFVVSLGKVTAGNEGDTLEVWLAITESGLRSRVTAGENAGEELHHASIVRVLRKMGVANPIKQNAFSELNLPIRPEWKRKNLRAVVFVQSKHNRQILGAAVTSLHE